MSAKKNKKNIPSYSKAKVPVIKHSAPVDSISDHDVILKEETLTWTFSILCSLIVYIVAALVVHNIYHPDLSVLYAAAKDILIDTMGVVRPEPVEAMLFRLGVVIIIPSFIGFYIFFSKKQIVKALAQKPFFIFFTTLCVVGIVAMIYFDFAAANPYVNGGPETPQNSRDFVGKTNFDFFFDGIFLGKYFLVYTFILVPALACLFFIGIKKYAWDDNKLFQKIVSVTGYIVIGALLVVIICMSIFEYPYTF